MRRLKAMFRQSSLTILTVVALLGLGVAPTQAVAQGDVLQRLDTFSTTLKSFSADFTQVVYDADSNPLSESAGNVLLKRPGRFIWDYKTPSPQQIIADGKSVWLYDLELEQVTVSALAEQAAGTPVALLIGDRPLEEEFSIRAMGSAEGIDWVELTPKSNESEFEQVYIGLDKNGLAAMELRDNFGQATQIRFRNFKSDVPLSDSQFDFVPPAGVDVIGQG